MLVTPALAAGLVVALLLVLAARPRGGRAAAQLDAELAALGCSELETLEARVGEYETGLLAAQARHAAWEAERARRREQAAGIDAQLEAELDGAGIAAGPLAERLAGFRAAQRDAARRADLDAHITRAELERARAAEPLAAFDRAAAEVELAHSALAACHRRAGIDATDPQAAHAAFGARAARADADAELLAEAVRARRELGRIAAEGGGDPERAQAAAEQALREHVALHGELPDRDEDEEALERRGERLRGELAARGAEATELRARIAEREAGAPAPAALREALALVEARVARTERTRAAVRIAREELATAANAAHRAFAPHLNAALQRALPAITGGRYAAAVVDEQLAIRVEAPETGRLVPVNVLSRGTRDQIAMVERLEIARMLDPTGGALPLLLDDPFAHFDPERLEAGASLLAEVAAERQVVVFTDDPAVLAALELAAGAPVLELPGPAPARQVV